MGTNSLIRLWSYSGGVCQTIIPTHTHALNLLRYNQHTNTTDLQTCLCVCNASWSSQAQVRFLLFQFLSEWRSAVWRGQRQPQQNCKCLAYKELYFKTNIVYVCVDFLTCLFRRWSFGTLGVWRKEVWFQSWLKLIQMWTSRQ